MNVSILECSSRGNRAFPFTAARRIKNVFTLGLWAVSLLLFLAPSGLLAQQAVDEDAPWPRVRSANGNTVTLYQPQVESWTSNSFNAYAAVEVKAANAGQSQLGVIWFEAQCNVDRPNRLVALNDLHITRCNFPDATDGGSNDLALVTQLFPGGARTVSLDYLITALGFAQAAARQATPQNLNNTPPDIIWSTNRAVLVIIDGDPVFRPIPNSTLQRVINTPVFMVRNGADGKFYLSGQNLWYAADAIAGPWSLVQIVPPEVAAVTPQPDQTQSGQPQGPPPKIIVSTRPAELLVTDGMPNFQPVQGTALLYAVDCDSQLFFYPPENTAYVLLSGRWFKAASLQGPWTYVKPGDLPEEFSEIPSSSPQGVVLASVAGTPQAELAMVANSMPTTATVNRDDAKIDLSYDGGAPKFQPIEGTSMSYAINAQLPVISTGTNFYAVDNAVWFVASSPTGPWEVATEVPEEIYTIPPSSPVYYATFVRIYDSDTNTVETGYMPGYQGAYEEDGTTVYGTGYDYEPYYGNDYYGWGWTWGYNYWYVPWYGYWCWRPWWGAGNGLRAAMIDNIYDRWNTPGVMPHDRATTAARAAALQNYSGYPALYGRFRGATGTTPFRPPASTLALNPYSRPGTPFRPGETPQGAQLLSAVRQSPGGGRDLYASPDGNIYQRRTDGWYRQGGGGNWNYYAPVQGQIQTSDSLVAGNGANRINAQNAAAARAQAANRVANMPNVNAQARAQAAQRTADLDRQYYSRQLGQARAQNMRQANRSAPARGGGFRGGGGRR